MFNECFYVIRHDFPSLLVHVLLVSFSLAQMSLLELNYAFESVERSTVCRTTQFRAIDF
jgi:hypothetical protein